LIVSIHAPAWGATLELSQIKSDFNVSIHAPAWGATDKPCPAGGRFAGFNPRARVGRDPFESLEEIAKALFQSTRPRGARQEPLNVAALAKLFQSTRPRGARRPAWKRRWSNTACFNPRARVGRDMYA